MSATRSSWRRPLGAAAVLGVCVLAAAPLAAAAPQDGPPDGPGQGFRRGFRMNEPQDGEGGRRGGFGGERGPGRFRGPGGGMAGLGDLLEADFLRRDLRLFSEELELRDSQRAVLDVLFMDYDEGFRAGVEPVNELMRNAGPRIFQSFMSPETRDVFRSAMESAQAEIAELRDKQGGEVDSAVVEEIMGRAMSAASEDIQRIRRESGQQAEARAAIGEMIAGLEAWQAEKAALREQFISGVKGQLDEAQLSRWPAFERRMTREKSLPDGRLSGESVDLVQLAKKALERAEAPSELAPVLELYEIRLVEALKARDTYLEQSQTRLYKALQDMDVPAGLDIVKRQTDLRVRVRDVNEEFRPAIAAALPEPARVAFLREALTSGYSRLFRPTRAERTFEAARELDTLPPETLEAIAALELAYESEMAALTERLIAITKKEEPGELVRQAERMAGFLSGNFQRQREEDPIRASMGERRELSDRYLNQLAGLLSPEQFENIAPSQERREFGGGFNNMPEGMRSRILERADRNGNGQIDPEEEEAAREQFRQRRAQPSI